MSIIAAFLWKKSPKNAICTMILDDKSVQFLLLPKIQYLPKGFFNFRRAARKIIKEFFEQIESLPASVKNPIRVEYKIVFNAPGVFYIFPAKESAFVYKAFISNFKKVKKKLKHSIVIKPQLRSRLSGKALKRFKKELKSLFLVSRKRETGFEYHLWTVVLHATNATYQVKLKRLRERLIDKMWKDELKH